MSLVDEVAKVLRDHPEIIASALESRPEVVYAVLAKLTPWDKLATKEDLKMLVDMVDRRFQEVNRRFEDVNKRFEEVNRRFEDIKYYVDRRVGFLERLIVGLNIPILATVIATLIKLTI